MKIRTQRQKQIVAHLFPIDKNLKMPRPAIVIFAEVTFGNSASSGSSAYSRLPRWKSTLLRINLQFYKYSYPIPPYPFTAPLVIPSMICVENAKYRTTIGISVMITAAMVSLIYLVNWPT